MLRPLVATALLLLASSAFAVNQTPQNGVVLKMRLIPCLAQSSGVMKVLSGTAPMPTEHSCLEYLFRSENVVYELQAVKPVILPLGRLIQFRLGKNVVILQLGNDEARFSVIGMWLRPSTPAAQADADVDWQDHANQRKASDSSLTSAMPSNPMTP